MNTIPELRQAIEDALRQSLATFPTNDRRRTCYLVAALVALFEIDIDLANRFLKQHLDLCD